MTAEPPMPGSGPGAHQWRGLIEEYRDRLPVSDDTPVITLREGGTPLVRSAPLSDETGCEVWLKYDGSEPDRLVQGPGHDPRDLEGSRGGREGRRLRLDGQHERIGGRLCRARPASTCAVLVPRGKVAIGKMAQTLVHGARVLEVEGNFDDSLELAKDLAERFPVTLVNSVNPYRLQGQKTCAFEIVDALGRAPDLHCVPVGNAGNISSHWIGYSEYLADGVIAEPPQLMGFQAQGAAPIVRGEPVKDPQTIATAIRIGNPASWDWPSPPRASPRGRSARSPTERSSPPIVEWRARDCSPSPPAPRASPDCCACTPRASCRRGRPSSAS